MSRTTASRVINGKPGVNPQTRKHVLDAVGHLGYGPHAVARSLATKRTQIIGIFIPTPVSTLFGDPFFSVLLQGIVHAAAAHDHQVLLTLLPETEDSEACVRSAQNGYTDGAIAVASALMSETLLPWLQAADFPLVCVGRWANGETSFVDVDNIGGARQATEHFLRLGHRRIGTITGPLQLPVAADRLRGVEEALRAYGLHLPHELILEADFTELGGMLAMQRLLRAKPEAVFAQSDAMAIGALKAIRQAGLRVPDDLALVGFDDLPLAEHVDPPLTTVRQPIPLLGHMAVEVLLSQIAHPQRKVRRQVVLPTDLVVRESCGAFRAAKGRG